MPRKLIEVGIEGNDGTGDAIREAMIKVNDNFQELYSVFASGAQFVSSQDSNTGYVKFINGTVQAWGRGVTDSLGTQSISYPIAMTSVKSITLTPTNAGKVAIAVSAFDNVNGFSVQAWNAESNANMITDYFWFVVGFAE